MIKKRFNVISSGNIYSDGLKMILIDKLTSNGWIFDKEQPQIAVSIGGDGTMLDAFQIHKDNLDSVAFIGLHTGHLGFYADWNQSEIEEFVHSLLHVEPKIVTRPIVEMSIDKDIYRAINEITIKNLTRTFIASIYINGEHFEDFRGDGLCISTPTGSTAYNKSLNGAVVHPALDCIQLSEINSINNNVYRTLSSSIVLPKNHVIEIKFSKKEEDFIVITCDRKSAKIGDHESIKLYVGNEKANFARYREFTFWNRIKESFI